MAGATMLSIFKSRTGFSIIEVRYPTPSATTTPQPTPVNLVAGKFWRYFTIPFDVQLFYYLSISEVEWAHLEFYVIIEFFWLYVIL